MNKLVTYYEGNDPQEFIDEHMNLIVALQGFKPLLRIDKVNSNVYRFDIREVTDFAVEELNYDSDWIVSDFAPQSGINHFDKQGNCTLVKRGLYLHEAKALCKELNKHEAKIAAKLNDAYEASVFCATELY